MQVEIVRGCIADGAPRAPGQRLDLPERDARQIIGTGHAREVTIEDSPPATPRRSRRSRAAQQQPAAEPLAPSAPIDRAD